MMHLVFRRLITPTARTRDGGLSDRELGAAHRPAPTGQAAGQAHGLMSARVEAGKENEIKSHDREPDVGPEVIEPAPGAARQAVGAFQV